MTDGLILFKSTYADYGEGKESLDEGNRQEGSLHLRDFGRGKMSQSEGVSKGVQDIVTCTDAFSEV